MNNTDIPEFMSAVVLSGHGGFDKLEYREDIEVPKAGAGEVLIRVGASAINNTDINTRTGWYSKGVTAGTEEGAASGFASASQDDGSWSGKALNFPLIQGADVCGTIVAVGEGVDVGRTGERVLVRPMQQAPDTPSSYNLITFGSECNGGYAEYAVARSSEVFAVNSILSDAELASFPCAYSTAEGMLEKSGLKSGERILITGASGGVGSAAIQLARRRGAEVIAVCGESKFFEVRQFGADQVIARGQSLLDVLEKESVQVVADLVAGPQWPDLLEILARGGRYVASGAIAGPIVELDVRTLYLKDLSLFGSTWQPRSVFENLIGYIERNEIRPVVAKTYGLRDVVQAQKDFMAKRFSGKLAIEISKRNC
ncbi:alcohol dehydrogenase family protein [Marinobacter sp. ANT_B65]|uniref:alcohol dehydrogenase family protein n=1 Tax=Marinobacter sp. ANT_B65 TaxID=2039467 RepID=UPI000BBE9066|nr:alcohol dehydrogenase family protein [Marinobacter sp. ANT_B65]PCM45864.1 alcohol dehydrogenase [Marinobacter sp. ANT_B65]